jgi:hypothetical protein
MVMGERGMKDMTEMEMPLPDNTAPMMTGRAPSARSAWAACSACVKVRKDQKRGDYSDPGWYQHPPGTVAYEFTGACPTRRASRPRGRLHAGDGQARQDIEVKVRKPAGGHGGH